MLLEDAPFHKFNEMSTIGPWIDRQGKLQWDYVTAAGFKGARNVRNGNATKAALIESEGCMFNEHDKLCITGSHKLGKLGGAAGGAATKAALIESEGYMFNEHNKLCITGYHKLGELGGATTKARVPPLC